MGRAMDYKMDIETDVCPDIPPFIVSQFLRSPLPPPWRALPTLRTPKATEPQKPNRQGPHRGGGCKNCYDYEREMPVELTLQ